MSADAEVNTPGHPHPTSSSWARTAWARSWTCWSGADSPWSDPLCGTARSCWRSCCRPTSCRTDGAWSWRPGGTACGSGRMARPSRTRRVPSPGSPSCIRRAYGSGAPTGWRGAGPHRRPGPAPAVRLPGCAPLRSAGHRHPGPGTDRRRVPRRHLPGAALRGPADRGRVHGARRHVLLRLHGHRARCRSRLRPGDDRGG